LEQNPQLHIHAVVINATQDKDGTWRSLEPRLPAPEADRRDLSGGAGAWSG
jgi:hypothetical protein